MKLNLSLTVIKIENKKQKKKALETKFPRHGALKGTRTPDLLVRSQSLYPAELSAHFRAVIFDCPYIITHLFEKINP